MMSKALPFSGKSESKCNGEYRTPVKTIIIPDNVEIDTAMWEGDADWNSNAPFTALMKSFPTYRRKNDNAACYEYVRRLKAVARVGTKMCDLICILCARAGKTSLLTKQGTSTSTELYHLRNVHQDIYLETQKRSVHSIYTPESVRECLAINAKSKTNPTLLTLGFEPAQPTKKMDATSKKFHDSEFATWLARRNRPNNLLLDTEFRMAVHHLRPEYSLPYPDKALEIQIALGILIDQKLTQSLLQTANFHQVNGTTNKFLTALWDPWTKGKLGFLE